MLLSFLFISEYRLIVERVTLQSNNFLVEIKGTQAVLSWSKPTGSFDKQVIEKWKFAKRVKREVMSACLIAGNCEEDVIPIEQTSHTADIDPDMQYKFILVLYDGEVKVAQFEAEQIKPKGKLVKVPYCHIYDGEVNVAQFKPLIVTLEGKLVKFSSHFILFI